jgi:N-acetyl-anhydromuramyl-L-alanine amidase AmpD
VTDVNTASGSCLAADQSGLAGAHDPLSADTAHQAQQRLQGTDAPTLGGLITEFRQCRACSAIPREASQIDVLVMHTPEGPCAPTLAVLDGTDAGFDFYLPLGGTFYQCNDFNRFVAWQAGEWNTNLRSVGIEQGDYAAHSGEFPQEHYDRLAQLVAAIVSVTSIPVQRATGLGQPGIIAHRDVTPGLRTDPGDTFNWDLLFQLVAAHMGASPPQPAEPPTLDQLEAANPNIRQQLVDWRQMRVQQGADPGDYAAFRQHEIDLGAPDPGDQELTGFRVPTLDDLAADNPNIQQQLVDWRQMRAQQGADPGDYAAFRQHEIDLGAPDPGEQEFIGFRA